MAALLWGLLVFAVPQDGRTLAAPAGAAGPWSETEQRHIQSIARTLKQGEDGYWTYGREEWQVKSSASAELAAEAGSYVDLLLKAFSRTFGLTPNWQTARFRLVLHDAKASFAAASGANDAETSACKVSVQGGGALLAEVHVLVAPPPPGEASPHLSDRTTAGALQYQAARALLLLCTGGRPLPPFFREGCALYFQNVDLRDQRAGGESRMALHGQRPLLEALQGALAGEAPFRPDLFALLHQSEEAFTREDEQLHRALAASFIDFTVSSPRRQSVPRGVVAVLARSPATNTQATAVWIDAGTATAMEPDWRRHLCHIVAYSLPVVHADIPVEGSPAGEPSRTQLSAYGHAPLVSVMAGARGACDVAWYDRAARTIRILQCDANGRKAGECSPAFIQEAGGLLGAAKLPGAGCYVVAYSKDNASGDKAFELWIARFDKNGKRLFDTRIFGDKSSQELWSKGGPGGAGSGRVAYNPVTDRIGFYCSHSMKWPDGVRHQGGYMGFLKPDGSQVMQSGDKPLGDGWYFSHNFDQRLIVANGAFYALAQGDAYPRALGFSKWADGGGKSLLLSQTYHTIPGNTGDNTTHCQTGGLVLLPDKKSFAVLFATSNDRPSHDVGLKILDDNGKCQRETWLTAYGPDRYAAFPRLARYGDDILVLWEEVAAGARDSVAQLMVVTPSLATVMGPAPLDDVHVSPCNDLVNLDDGAVVWATSAGSAIRLYRIDAPAVAEAKLLARLTETAPRATTARRTPKPGTLEGIDKKMIAKLSGLAARTNDVLKGTLRVSFTKVPVRLVAAAAAGDLTFEAEGADGKRASRAYGSLALSDRARLALALARFEPENTALFGVAAFYFDCAGERAAARECYLKAGKETADTIASYLVDE